VRSYERAPSFTLVILMTLALGIGASTAIFSLVNGILLQPLPLADPDRLVYANEVNGKGDRISIAWPNFLDWRARARSFASLALSREESYTLTGTERAVALTLASVGLYGVVAHGVTERTHEIGVRMALGAGGRHVLGLVVRQGLSMALLGTAIGVGGSVALSIWIQGLLFGVTATDPFTIGAVAAMLCRPSRWSPATCRPGGRRRWIPPRRYEQSDPQSAIRNTSGRADVRGSTPETFVIRRPPLPIVVTSTSTRAAPAAATCTGITFCEQ
jgi:hypothetical protein